MRGALIHWYEHVLILSRIQSHPRLDPSVRLPCQELPRRTRQATGVRQSWSEV